MNNHDIIIMNNCFWAITAFATVMILPEWFGSIPTYVSIYAVMVGVIVTNAVFLWKEWRAIFNGWKEVSGDTP